MTEKKTAAKKVASTSSAANQPSKAASGKKSPAERAYAIILAGGSGTRLWPLSRALLPKQLLALKGERSLLQDTAARCLPVIGPERILTVTNEEHVFEVRGQLKALDPALESRVLAEPTGRNTLPAILLGMDPILQEEPDALAAVFPSDHHIEDAKGFAAALEKGFAAADKGRFVTFGVVPTGPETGYGYIQRGAALDSGVFAVKRFVEKPERDRAERFVKSGDYFWNSGMFVFKVKEFLKAVAKEQPELYAWWKDRVRTPLIQGYGRIPDVSVDYGVMERIDAEAGAVVEAGFGWDDLGSWEALYRLSKKDERGVAVDGDVLPLDCDNCLLLSKGGKLAAVGLKDVIAVATHDATLICSMSEVQKVKDVVTVLKAQGSPLVTSHVTVRRPWGSYTVLEEASFYKLKRIVVNPGAKLSLQMHHHRSEHWVCIAGTAEVQVGEEVMLLTENQSVDIPKTAKHRLSNPGKVPVEIIEIQNGPYLEEDDIVRFDDVYGRKKS